MQHKDIDLMTERHWFMLNMNEWTFIILKLLKWKGLKTASINEKNDS